MKKLHMAIGLVVLLAATISVTAATNVAAPKQTELTLVVAFTFNTGASPTLNVGDRGYAEGNISVEEGLGEPVIGELHTTFVSTEPVGTAGSVAQTVWRITGEGDIWVVRVVDVSGSPPIQGAIIGGTGKFAGASGQYSATVINPLPDLVLRATFEFDKAIKP